MRVQTAFPSINAGSMRDQIVIQSISTERDSMGGSPDQSDDANWADFVSGWANISPVPGRELTEADKQQAESMVNVLMRWVAGIDTTMRMVTSGRKYDIRSIVDVDGRQHALRLVCRELR